MKKIITTCLLLYCIITLSACSNNKDELEKLQTENEKLTAELEAMQNEKANEEVKELNEEDYIKRSEEYRTGLEKMHETLNNHYAWLIEEYNRQQLDYNIDTWTVFLNSWNKELSEYRNELDSYKVNGHTSNLFYAKNQLSMAATNMSAVWLYYSDLLDNKNDENAKEQLIYFDSDINKCLGECYTNLE